MVDLKDFCELKPHAGKLIPFGQIFFGAGDSKFNGEFFEERNVNEIVTGGEEGVFIARACDDSAESDIRDGDLLIVNRNLHPERGTVIAASRKGVCTVEIYPPSGDFKVFGVVTHVVKQLKNF